MNESINESINEIINESMNKPMNESMNKPMNEIINQPMNEIMNISVMVREEMDAAGGLQFFHPDHPGYFIVVEQKLDEAHDFIPVEQGVHVFTIRPGDTTALREDIHPLIPFVQDRIQDGWKLDPNINIPKRNPFQKWQLCPLLR